MRIVVLSRPAFMIPRGEGIKAIPNVITSSKEESLPASHAPVRKGIAAHTRPLRLETLRPEIHTPEFEATAGKPARREQNGARAASM